MDSEQYGFLLERVKKALTTSIPITGAEALDIGVAAAHVFMRDDADREHMARIASDYARSLRVNAWGQLCGELERVE